MTKSEYWQNVVDSLLQHLGDTLDMITGLQDENKGTLTFDMIRQKWRMRSLGSRGMYIPISGPQQVAPTPSARVDRRCMTATAIEEDLIREASMVMPRTSYISSSRASSISEDNHEDNLVEDDNVEMAFIAGCLESIRQRNFAVQGEVIKNSQAERGVANVSGFDEERGDA